MNYKITKGNNSKVIVMFHGTGGNADSLLTIAKYLDKDATYIGLEGNVIEDGMRRFFRRFGLGLFDYENVAVETLNVKNAIDDIIKKENYDLNKITLIGYSNGANMIQSLLKVYPNYFKYNMMLHPSLVKNEPFNRLEESYIFLSTSEEDPYSTKEQIENLITHLNKSGAHLKIIVTDRGHSVTEKEITEAKKWYEKNEMGL